VKVHYGEELANHTGPESCVSRREVTDEASTGVRAGQPLSGENRVVRSADALVVAESNTGRREIASAYPAPRRLRPWHAPKFLAREPGELQHYPGMPSWDRFGKTKGRSR
jgi:RNA-directed DNA polymerase